MRNLKEISLPGSISLVLPFKRAIDDRGTILERSLIEVSGFKILSSKGDLGDPQMVMVILESAFKKIIEDIAEPKVTLVSLASAFNGSEMVPVPGRPGIFLKKDLIFKEL